MMEGIQFKKCKGCGEEKELSEFYCHMYKTKKVYQSQCKLCEKKKAKEYYDDPITGSRIKEKITKWRKDHPDYGKEWTTKNPEYQREWNSQNPDYLKDYHKEHMPYNLIRRKERYHTEPEFRLMRLLRSSLRRYLKANNEDNHSIDMLGCTLIEYRNHLEQQFLPEMNWGNHGDIWEIDHVLPLNSFDLTIEENILKCFHYTNTQPLFKTTKIAKSFGYMNYIGNREKKDKIL